VWGHMRVWCRGAALGNVGKRYCGLHHAYASFGWLASHLDEL
jgi:hypothetical protein